MKRKVYLLETKSIVNRIKLFFNFKKDYDLIHIFSNYQLHTSDYELNKRNNTNEVYLKEKIQEEITFKANKIALKFVDNLNISNNSYFKLLEKYLNSEKVVYAYRKSLIENIENKVRFYLIYQYLCSQYASYNVIPLQSKPDEFNLNKQLNFNQKNNLLINIEYKIKNFILTVFFIPLWLVKKILSSGIHFKNKKAKTYSVCQHLVNGFNSKVNNYKFKKSRTDELLYKNLSNKIKDNFVFVFSKWNFNKEETEEYKKYLESLKIKYIDEYKNSINIFYIFKNVIFIYIQLIKLGFISIFKKDSSFNLGLITNRLFRSTFEIETFISHFKPKVFFGRDDYDSIHIIRTIVLNRHQCNQVGFRHSAFLYPYISTSHSFTYFNEYFLAGDKYFTDLFKNTWYSEKNTAVGQPFLDNIFEAKNDLKARYKFDSLVGSSNLNILVSIPSVRISTPFENIHRIIEKFGKLEIILEKIKNVNIIIRCRSLNDTKVFREVIKIPEKYSKRVFYVTNEFNTYELISFCNIIIGNDTSSLLLESIGFKEKLVIPFNIRFKDKKNLIWHDYDYKHLCNDLDEIIRTVRNFQISKSYSLHDQNLKEIISGYSYPFDGNAWKRVSQNIELMLSH